MKKLRFLLAYLVLAGAAVAVAQLPPPPAAPPPPSHTLIVQPEDGRDAVLAVIREAKKTLTLTIYEVGDPAIDQALIQAQQGGVNVRVLYNYYSFLHQGRPEVNQSTIAAFEAAGIECRRANPAFAVTHQKTLTADEAVSVIMTFNLKTNYFGGTRDFGIVTRDPAEVAEIASVFGADWQDQPVTPRVPSLVWSPVNSRQKILDTIGAARKTLEVYNEEAEDPECLSALAAAAGRGVKVRFLTAVLKGKETDGNQAGRDLLNARGVEAKPAAFLYIHAKMVLADAGTPDAVAFLGSENFSKTSLDRNRELGIIVRERPMLDRLHGTFESDWAR